MMQNNHRGLSLEEARSKLKKFGYNEIPEIKSYTFLKAIFNALREPMLLLLMACAVIYFFLGEVRDSIILSCSVFFVLGIALYQKQKSEKAIEALKELSHPRALVVRGGKEIKIPSREVVPDDILIVSEGDRIPADAILLSSQHLKVDESLLTGEAFAVEKTASTSQEAQLFSGTLVVAGRGTCRVTKIGLETQMGRIGKSLQEKKNEDQTLLQRELSRFVRIFAAIGLGISSVIAVSYGWMHDNWPQGLLVGIAAAMSLIPEEFPVVLTVFLAIGAWRISKAKVLTRKVSSTEQLGSITVLCVDKTGTITQNQMIVRVLEAHNESQWVKTEEKSSLPMKLQEVIKYAVLSSKQNPFDPMEKAIHEMANKSDIQGELIREYPFSKKLLAMTCIWQETTNSASFIVASKGAPETILNLCRLPTQEQEKVLRRVQHFASQGLRILGVAKGKYTKEQLPDEVKDYNLEFLGLVGFEDPIRPEVPTAVQTCYNAGIRVIMMTGDYPATAHSIGKKIGLLKPENVMTGAALKDFNDAELRESIQNTNIFARMIPEEKLRIIQGLKSNGEIVAMTGDGVNDAPSLKWADIGIAMGERGTDVAREAASIVLLDDNFASIVEAIRLGRRIFDNIQKAMAYIISVHIPIAGMALFPVLFNLPLVLLPAHVVFLELIIDPASALLFEGEPAERNIMNRPPRSLSKPLFGFDAISRHLVQGSIVLLFVFSAYLFTLHQQAGGAVARSVAFATLTLSNLGLILTTRSKNSSLIKTLKTKNRTFFWLALGTLLFLILILHLPFTQEVFRFGRIGLQECGVILTSVFLSFGLNRLISIAWIKRKPIQMT